MPNDLLQQILNKVNSIEEKVNSTDTTIKSMQSQFQEQGLVLRALEHKTDIIKANQEVIKYYLIFILEKAMMDVPFNKRRFDY